MKHTRILLCSCFIFLSTTLTAQEEPIFEKEVRAIQKKYDSLWDHSKKTVVFTGSSSIRIWHDVDAQFPNHQIVNTGFGGSKAQDLLQYADPLILRFKPHKVFIYEGDNDIAGGQKPQEIIDTMLQIIKKIRVQNPACKIVLIAAKPSIARWNLKKDYKRLNRKFKRLAKKDADLLYADVWKPMLPKNKLQKELFLEDGLHMNKRGYAIWYNVLHPFLD